MAQDNDTNGNNNNTDDDDASPMGAIRRFRVLLKSLTPILMHRDNIEFSDDLKKWQQHPDNKKTSKAGDDRSPAWSWLGCLYDEDEYVVIPQENIMKCLLQGGAAVPVPGGKGGKTFKSQTQSGIQCTLRGDSGSTGWPLKINGKLVPTAPIYKLRTETDFDKHKEAVTKLGFSLFVKRARIGNNKHVRVRPKFGHWECEGELDVYDDQITEEVLKQIFHVCGNYKGLCDWRPSSGTPGSWGRFTTTVTRVSL